MGELIVALIVANGLALTSLTARIVPSGLVVLAPPLLVLTASRDPLVVLLAAAFVVWMSATAVVDERHETFAIATTVCGVLFIDGAAFAACGHAIVAVECAAAAVLVRRLMLANARVAA